MSRSIRADLIAELDAALEDGLRCLNLLPEVERRMRASLAEPGGHGFEVVTHSTVLVCEVHQRDLGECQHDARQRGEAFACTGVPVATVSDPTGEGACRDHAIREDVRELRRHVRRIGGDVKWIVGLVERWMSEDRVPLRDPKAKADTPLCEVHLRFGYDRPALSKGTRVKVKGVPILADPHRLCEWCIDQVRKRGRLPVEVEVRDHVEGLKPRIVRDDETPAEERQRDSEHRRRSA